MKNLLILALLFVASVDLTLPAHAGFHRISGEGGQHGGKFQNTRGGHGTLNKSPSHMRNSTAGMSARTGNHGTSGSSHANTTAINPTAHSRVKSTSTTQEPAGKTDPGASPANTPTSPEGEATPPPANTSPATPASSPQSAAASESGKAPVETTPGAPTIPPTPNQAAPIPNQAPAIPTPAPEAESAGKAPTGTEPATPPAAPEPAPASAPAP